MAMTSEAIRFRCRRRRPLLCGGRRLSRVVRLGSEFIPQSVPIRVHDTIGIDHDHVATDLARDPLELGKRFAGRGARGCVVRQVVPWADYFVEVIGGSLGERFTHMRTGIINGKKSLMGMCEANALIPSYQ